MKFTPTTWGEVKADDVVYLAGAPRRVLDVIPQAPGVLLVLAEGGAPYPVSPTGAVALVELDEADAVSTLLAAGFTLEPIQNTEGNGS